MTGFLNGYLDLRGRTVSSFRIAEHMGRMPGGEPRWQIVCCRCNHSEVLPHNRLLPFVTSQGQLQCPNLTCASRTARQSETLTDVRRREKREAETAAQAQIEHQIAADAAAAQVRIEAQRKAAQTADYRKYWLHVIRRDARPVSLQTWLRFGAADRQRALEIIDQGGFVEITERE